MFTLKWARVTRVTNTHTHSDTLLWSPQPPTVTCITLTTRRNTRVHHMYSDIGVHTILAVTPTFNIHP